MPRVGQTARRTRAVTTRAIEKLFMLVGEDKPLTRLRTTITNQRDKVVLDGTALVWTEPM